MQEDNSGLRALLQRPAVYETFQRLVGKNRLRRRFVDEYVHADTGDRVLDIGCGPGYLVPYLGDVTYDGFDISAAYVRHARSHYGDIASFHDGELSDLVDRLTGRQDIVTAVGVLHHTSDEVAADSVGQAWRALRPGGRFVALEPYLAPDQPRIAKAMIERDRGQHVRSPDGYVGLVDKHFDHVDVSFEADMLRIPYSIVILEATR